MKLYELRQLTENVPKLPEAQLQQWVHQQLQKMGLDPSAIYQELEMASRFVDTHRDISWSDSHTALHSHTFYELLYCINSCGAEYLVGSQRYRLEAGDIVLVPPGVSHRPILPENMSVAYERYVLWLSPEFMQLYAQLFSCPIEEKQSCASMLRTAGTPWEHLGGLFRAGVLEAERQMDSWESALVGNTITLLTAIKRASAQHATQPLKAEKPELLDRIMGYIEKNYANAITLDTLAKQFYVSSSTISHLFKQKLGVSFYSYVTQRRLIAAKTRIEKGQLLEEVAVQTGFSEYSGFYRAFKNQFGISPRQYRALQESSGKSSAF